MELLFALVFHFNFNHTYFRALKVKKLKLVL